MQYIFQLQYLESAKLMSTSIRFCRLIHCVLKPSAEGAMAQNYYGVYASILKEAVSYDREIWPRELFNGSRKEQSWHERWMQREPGLPRDLRARAALVRLLHSLVLCRAIPGTKRLPKEYGERISLALALVGQAGLPADALQQSFYS